MVVPREEFENRVDVVDRAHLCNKRHGLPVVWILDREKVHRHHTLINPLETLFLYHFRRQRKQSCLENVVADLLQAWVLERVDDRFKFAVKTVARQNFERVFLYLSFDFKRDL